MQQFDLDLSLCPSPLIYNARRTCGVSSCSRSNLTRRLMALSPSAISLRISARDLRGCNRRTAGDVRSGKEVGGRIE